MSAAHAAAVASEEKNTQKFTATRRSLWQQNLLYHVFSKILIERSSTQRKLATSFEASSARNPKHFLAQRLISQTLTWGRYLAKTKMRRRHGFNDLSVTSLSVSLSKKLMKESIG